MARGKMFSWALYDWANSAFATVVLAGLFPILYRDYWAAGQAEEQITFELGLANSLTGVILLLLGPLLGTFADYGNHTKKMLGVSVGIGSLLTLLLGCVYLPGEAWVLALFVISTSAFLIGNIFYDALLMEVSDVSSREKTSAFGYALGYLGGGILLLLVVLAVVYYQEIGFDNRFDAMLSGFVLTGIWWLVFSLPLLFTQLEHRSKPHSETGWQRFRNTLSLIRGRPELAWFLVAYWLYIDGVGTIIRMATNYGQVLGFSVNDLMLALLIVQFVGFPATLAYGYFAARFGGKQAILTSIIGYVFICAGASVMESTLHFYLLAAGIGVFQGVIQAQSRSLFSWLIPPERKAQLFGVYNLVGKFATTIGPFLMAYIGLVSGSPRWGIFSISLLFIAGGLLLFWKVPASILPTARKT